MPPSIPPAFGLSSPLPVLSYSSIRRGLPLPQAFDFRNRRTALQIPAHASPCAPVCASVSVPVAAAERAPAAPLHGSELRLYNTLAREKQPFTTVEPDVVRFYSCGPTVYDYAHIGNFRAFLTYDVIKRWLMYRGYNVNHVMNITDVDDKIIRKVRQLDCTADELTNKYADAFFADLDLLNVVHANHYPRATQHIADIEEIIIGLRKKGFAYERNGSTYFSVSDFEPYGRLAQLEKREASTAGADGSAALDSDEYGKEDARDFALWKAHKEEDGDVAWESSLGRGRPGWHIECSCMAMQYLGQELDIHGGGIDLVFPHHENEIAQSEALTGRPLSRFWVHNGFVNIDNEKMSKSLGNFRTLRDIVRKPNDARAFRYLVVSSQYRSALAFTEQCLQSARNTIKRLDALRARLNNVITESSGRRDNGPSDDIAVAISRAQVDFVKAMDDDLNTPRAAAAMFSLVNSAEKRLKAGSMEPASAACVLSCMEDMDRVFGVFYMPELGAGSDKTAAGDADCTADASRPPPHLVALLDERSVARKAKNFARADEIRDIMAAAGFAIVDTPAGAQMQPLDTQ